MQVSYQTNTNFTSRCIPVRAGQQACFVIAKELPHYSPSLVWYRVNKTEKYAEKFNEVAQFAEEIMRYNRRKHMAMGLNQYVRVLNSIKTVLTGGVGNCNEVSDIAASILRRSGYNAGVTGIKWNGSALDHMVCVFNRNNKPVDKITRDTIIVDPWLGECDFAGNIFKKYKNEYAHIFGKDLKINGKNIQNGKFGITNVNYFNMTELESNMIELKYPQLRIPAKYYGTFQQKPEDFKKETVLTKVIDYLKDLL